MCVCVCERERERERGGDCVYICERQERDGVCVCAREELTIFPLSSRRRGGVRRCGQTGDMETVEQLQSLL